jgi:hypothetical protein
VLEGRVLKGANCQVEDVTLDLALIAYWVVVGELNRLDALKVFDPVEASLAD